MLWLKCLGCNYYNPRVVSNTLLQEYSEGEMLIASSSNTSSGSGEATTATVAGLSTTTTASTADLLDSDGHRRFWRLVSTSQS